MAHEHGALSNPDLLPVQPAQRTWGMWNIAALWVGMSVCIPTYQLASGLVDQGMDWKQAIFTVLLGNVVVLLPMVLNAHAGTKYGIPFPVFARASFGALGANVPAILRALVACGWFGIQTWIGGAALYQLALAVVPSLKDGAVTLGFLGITPGELVAFLVFWASNVYFIWKGTESIKWMETLAAPFLIVAGLVLLGWAYLKAGSFGPILERPSAFAEGGAKAGQFWKVFWPSLTAMVGFWATLSLNIPDFTRYARSQKDQLIGQALGLPTTMTLFAFIGVAVTSATPVIFNQPNPIWDPVQVVARIGGFLTVAFSMLALSVATLSTNIAANVVSPANDIANIWPAKISFKLGGYITAVLGIAMMPWKLIASSQGYIFTWLIGYSALLGPVGGILIADYFLLRRRELLVEDLYKRGGAYEYTRGWNWRALAALAIGVLPNVPGFLAEAGFASSVGEGWRTLYTYAWFNGFLLAGAAYLALMKLLPQPAPAPAAPAA